MFGTPAGASLHTTSDSALAAQSGLITVSIVLGGIPQHRRRTSIKPHAHRDIVLWAYTDV